MASSLSPNKLTHLLLVLLVVTIFAASAQSHQAAVTYTLRGYIQNPLNLRPNGSSTISKTFYMTKTPNGYSGVVARWDVLLTSQAGDWESNHMALVWGVITPKTVLDGSDDYENGRLQPFLVEGLFNSSDLSGNLVVTGTQVVSQVLRGVVRGSMSLTCAAFGSNDLVSVYGEFEASI